MEARSSGIQERKGSIVAPGPPYRDWVAQLMTRPKQPIPQPPPIPPVPQGEPVSERLHAVERRAGESSWMAARRAFAEQQVAEQRKARQQMRAAMQAQPPRRNQSREINNRFAATRKPRGKGAAIIVDRPDWKTE